MAGWGYWVNGGGATTLWEGWKGGSSLNHIMFVDVSAWAYQWLAGIQQAENSIGFRKIVLKPNPTGALNSLKASYMAQCGATARLLLPAGCHLVGSSGISNPELASGSHELVARFE